MNCNVWADLLFYFMQASHIEYQLKLGKKHYYELLATDLLVTDCNYLRKGKLLNNSN